MKVDTRSLPMNSRKALLGARSLGLAWTTHLQVCLAVPLCVGLFACAGKTGEAGKSTGPSGASAENGSDGTTVDTTSDAGGSANSVGGAAMDTTDGGSAASGQAAGGQVSQPDGGTAGATSSGVCARSDTYLSWTYTQPDGSVYQLTVNEEPPSGDLVGEVVDSTPDSITIDTCPPDGDCDPEIHQFSFGFGSASVDISIPKGTVVRMQFDESIGGPPLSGQTLFFGLVLTNADALGPIQNPSEAGERLWLALSTQPVFPPVVSQYGDEQCTEDSPFFKTWDLVIGLDDSTVDLVEGETQTLTVDSGPQAGNYRVTNLSSHADRVEGAFPRSFAITRE